MKNKWKVLTGAFLLSVSLFSCSDDEPATEYDYDKYYVDNQPKEDEVKNQFSGKVVLLQPNSDKVMDYLNKRFINTFTELIADADAVVMDEDATKQLMEDTSGYAMLESIWDSNKILVFINPGAEAYTMVKRLRQEVGAPNADDLAEFEDIHVYATRADGASFYHERVDATSGITEAYLLNKTEDGQFEEKVEMTPFTPQPNDYNKGRLAENLTAWLKKYAIIGERRSVAFSRADATGGHAVNPVVLTYHRSITVKHDWIKEHCPDANVPAPVTIQADMDFVVHGAYSTDMKCDVYDINLSETFPANSTWTGDVYVYEKGLYDYKYTGGCYMGPDAKLYLKDITASSVQVEQPAPLPQTNGSYNNTHYPMQVGFGASLEGNLSTEPGLSAGLSMGITLPTTTTSFNHAEMPISFNKNNSHAEWNYTTDLDIYTARGWLNPKLNDYADVVKSYCKTDQAVTFLLKDSKNYGEKEVKLGCEFTFKTYNEYAENNSNRGMKYYYHKNFSFTLPKVSRYFERYLPYPLPFSEGKADGNEWGNLERYLMSNVNYRALCDETLLVGAQTEAGLEKAATTIWRKAIEALVTQYNGTKTTYEYVIGLADSAGHHLPLGLHIKKDGVWRLVENVDEMGQ